MVRNIYDYDTEKARHLRTKYEKTSRLSPVEAGEDGGGVEPRLMAVSDYFEEVAGGALLREQGEDGTIHRRENAPLMLLDENKHGDGSREVGQRLTCASGFWGCV